VTVRHTEKQIKSECTPVAVRRMVILNVSASITCAPELVPVGESRLVIA